MNFLTDTHALLWWFTDNPRISHTASENFILIPLDYPVLRKMVELTGIPELHDKIIASTAKYLNLPVITKDKTLHNFSSIKTVW
ncbi:MAG: type II toxin-antitoxin system VapC family toxin [Deferribacteres bacterium]|nr:type II toxin-antitoxin system VapC family toxin [Deferribacteres bacterium]